MCGGVGINCQRNCQGESRLPGPCRESCEKPRGTKNTPKMEKLMGADLSTSDDSPMLYNFTARDQENRQVTLDHQILAVLRNAPLCNASPQLSDRGMPSTMTSMLLRGIEGIIGALRDGHTWAHTGRHKIEGGYNMTCHVNLIRSSCERRPRVTMVILPYVALPPEATSPVLPAPKQGVRPPTKSSP